MRDGDGRAGARSCSPSIPWGSAGCNLAEILLIQARAANVATPPSSSSSREVQRARVQAPRSSRGRWVFPSRKCSRPRLDPQAGPEARPALRLDAHDLRRARRRRREGRGRYLVVFNDDGLPRLKVSSLYRRMPLARREPRRRRQELPPRKDARGAVALKSLDQRKRTIVRVAKSIVKKQRDFLDYGVAHLKPLV